MAATKPLQQEQQQQKQAQVIIPNYRFITSGTTLGDPESSSSSINIIEEEPPTPTTPTTPVAVTTEPSNEISWFKRQFDHACITPAVLAYRYKGLGTPENPYVVDFLPDDKRNPFLFSAWYKWTITAFKAIAVLAVAFVSTAYASAVGEIVEEFHIASPELAISGISLFVLGFAVGYVVVSLHIL